MHLDREELLIIVARYQHSPGEKSGCLIRGSVCSIRVHCKNDFVILTNCLLHCDGCSITVVKLIELLEVSAVPVELTKE